MSDPLFWMGGAFGSLITIGWMVVLRALETPTPAAAPQDQRLAAQRGSGGQLGPGKPNNFKASP
jgi:hypothetical protein